MSMYEADIYIYDILYIQHNGIDSINIVPKILIALRKDTVFITERKNKGPG